MTRARAEAFTVGTWLGTMQVTLAFALLCSQGGGAPSLVRTVAAWMVGGVIGALTLGPRTWSAVFVLAALLHVFAPWVLLRPDSSGSAFEGALGLFAASVGGACGAGFLRVRGREGVLRVTTLLASEGAGFAFGYVAASVVLVFHAPWLRVIGVCTALVAWGLRLTVDASKVSA